MQGLDVQTLACLGVGECSDRNCSDSNHEQDGGCMHKMRTESEQKSLLLAARNQLCMTKKEAVSQIPSYMLAKGGQEPLSDYPDLFIPR